MICHMLLSFLDNEFQIIQNFLYHLCTYICTLFTDIIVVNTIISQNFPQKHLFWELLPVCFSLKLQLDDHDLNFKQKDSRMILYNYPGNNYVVSIFSLVWSVWCHTWTVIDLALHCMQIKLNARCHVVEGLTSHYFSQ